MRAVVHSVTFSALVYVAIVMNALFTALQMLQGGEVWLSPSQYQSVQRTFLIIFALEMALKLIGLGWREYSADAWNRFDACLVALGVSAELIEAGLQSQGMSHNAQGGAATQYMILRFARLLRLVRMMRTLRVVGVSNKLRALVRTFFNMTPMVVSIFWLLIIVIYAFAIIGVEAFGQTGDLGSPEDYGLTKPSFSSMSAAVWTLAIVLIGNEWASVMSELMSSVYRMRLADSGESAALAAAMSSALLLSLYYVITNLVLLNLLMALVIEVYAVEVDKSARTGEKGKPLLDVLGELGQRSGGGGGGGDADDGGSERASAGERAAQQIYTVMTQSVRAAFSRFDKDGDGLVPIAKGPELLAQLGAQLSADEIALVVQQLDMDGSGFLEFREFLDWWQTHGLAKAFARFDADASGFIDASELATMLQCLGVVLSERDVQLALEQMDIKGDNRISFDELVRWWNRFDIMSVRVAQLAPTCACQSELTRISLALAHLTRPRWPELLPFHRPLKTATRSPQVFTLYDTDASGRINLDELGAVVRDLGLRATRKDLRLAIQQLDRNSDGLISLEEFFPLWKLMAQRTNARGQGWRDGEQVEQEGGHWEDSLFLTERTGHVSLPHMQVSPPTFCSRPPTACCLLCRVASTWLRCTVLWPAGSRPRRSIRRAPQEVLQLELQKLEGATQLPAGTLSHHAAALAASVLESLAAAKHGGAHREEIDREYEELISTVRGAMAEGSDNAMADVMESAMRSASFSKNAATALSSKGVLRLNALPESEENQASFSKLGKELKGLGMALPTAAGLPGGPLRLFRKQSSGDSVASNASDRSDRAARSKRSPLELRARATNAPAASDGDEHNAILGATARHVGNARCLRIFPVRPGEANTAPRDPLEVGLSAGYEPSTNVNDASQPPGSFSGHADGDCAEIEPGASLPAPAR